MYNVKISTFTAYISETRRRALSNSYRLNVRSQGAHSYLLREKRTTMRIYFPWPYQVSALVSAYLNEAPASEDADPVESLLINVQGWSRLGRVGLGRVGAFIGKKTTTSVYFPWPYQVSALVSAYLNEAPASEDADPMESLLISVQGWSRLG